jgi:predicted CopG family antitoxin
MGVKTITIDSEAYDLIAREKRDKESFSDVIKRTFGRKPTMADLLKAVRQYPLADDVLKNVDHSSSKMRKQKLRKTE